MEIGKSYEVKFTGKCVKKEIYKDDKVRAWVQNDVTNEMAIVIDDNTAVESGVVSGA